MKQVFAVAILVAVFAAGFQGHAAVQSLPIGSVGRVLRGEVFQTDQIVINVQVADSVADLNYGKMTIIYMDAFQSYSKSDGSTESVADLCQRASASQDYTELRSLLEKMMRFAVGLSLDPNNPAYQGKVIGVIADGDYWPDQANFIQSIGTFAVLNTFTLGDLKDSQGSTVIPESAFATDMYGAITHPINQGFFIDGLQSVEVLDLQGDVIGHGNVLSWWPNNVVVLYNNFVFGQLAGTIRITYLDQSVQVFSLADGSLLSPLPTISASLLSSPPGIRLTISGVPPGPFVLKFSENLKDWSVFMDNLPGGLGSITVDDPVSEKARFYRVYFGN